MQFTVIVSTVKQIKNNRGHLKRVIIIDLLLFLQLYIANLNLNIEFWGKLWHLVSFCFVCFFFFFFVSFFL